MVILSIYFLNAVTKTVYNINILKRQFDIAYWKFENGHCTVIY